MVCHTDTKERCGPACGAAHPSCQLSREERLDDVILRSQLESENPIELLLPAAQHHCRDRLPRGSLPQQLQAGAIGQLDIQHHDVGAAFSG